MLIREYQMAEASVVMLTYVAVGFVQRLRAGEEIRRWRFVALFGVLMGCTVSLGYFNAFYVIGLCLALAASCIRHHRHRAILLILLAGVAALVFAFVIYPGFFNFILHPTVHKSMAFRKFSLALSVTFAPTPALYLLRFLDCLGGRACGGILKRRIEKIGRRRTFYVVAVACSGLYATYSVCVDTQASALLLLPYAGVDVAGASVARRDAESVASLFRHSHPLVFPDSHSADSFPRQL